MWQFLDNPRVKRAATAEGLGSAVGMAYGLITGAVAVIGGGLAYLDGQPHIIIGLAFLGFALGAAVILLIVSMAVSRLRGEVRSTDGSAEPTRDLNAPHYSANPEATAPDPEAYNLLVAFCVDYLIPACEAQIRLQNALLRQISPNETLARLAQDQLRSLPDAREFWENYEAIHSGLMDSPGPCIAFEGIIERVHQLESGAYSQFCAQSTELARSTDLEPAAAFAEWNGWRFKHVKMTEAYPPIARDIRFGKLHRLRPARWGSPD